MKRMMGLLLLSLFSMAPGIYNDPPRGYVTMGTTPTKTRYTLEHILIGRVAQGFGILVY